MNSISSWFAKYSVWTHVVAAFAFLVGAFSYVPQFHAVVLQIYGLIPAWAQTAVLTAIALYAWYRNGEPTSAATATPSKTVSSSTSTTSALLVLMALLLFGSAAWAQDSSSTTGAGAATATTTTTPSTAATGISFTASTGAAAVIGDGGNKYVIATLSELLDLWDSKADTNGYKNRVYVLGDELVGDSTAGWNYYGGGVRVEPSRAFAGLLKSTNIPADSFKLYFDASIGNTISTAGVSNVSVLLGGGINAAVTSSGSVSWHPFQAKWLRRGGTNYGVLSTEIVAKW